MKLYRYLVQENETFFITNGLYADDFDFKKRSNLSNLTYWRLKHTEIETDHYIKPEFSNFFESTDVEEVIYNQYPQKIEPKIVKLTYQYEWRYQKSMLWFITPEKFTDDTDFREYIKKIVVLDLIDFRRFNVPNKKEINI